MCVCECVYMCMCERVCMCVYVCMCNGVRAYMYICVFENSKLSFHKQDVVFYNKKKLKNYKSDIKESFVYYVRMYVESCRRFVCVCVCVQA